MTDFNALPKDLHLQLFRFFGAPDLGRLSQVSRKYHHLANNDILWRELVKSELKTTFNIQLPNNFSWKEFYHRYLNLFKTPNNNYLQRLSAAKLTLDDIELCLDPLKYVDPNIFHQDSKNAFFYRNTFIKLHNKYTLISYYEPTYNRNNYSKYTSIDLYQMMINHLTPFDIKGLTADFKLIAASSVFIIATDQLDHITNIVHALVNKRSKKKSKFLPNLIIMTLDKTDEEFMSQVAALDISIAGIIPGKLDMSKSEWFFPEERASSLNFLDDNEKRLFKLVNDLRTTQNKPVTEQHPTKWCNVI